MDLTIGSINASGLRDRIKRREFFNWLRKKQMAMYFIQEAHCTENNMHDWRAEWGRLSGPFQLLLYQKGRRYHIV